MSYPIPEHTNPNLEAFLSHVSEIEEELPSGYFKLRTAHIDEIIQVEITVISPPFRIAFENGAYDYSIQQVEANKLVDIHNRLLELTAASSANVDNITTSWQEELLQPLVRQIPQITEVDLRDGRFLLQLKFKCSFR